MSGFAKVFTRFATAVSKWTGRPPVFATCCLLVVLWAMSGPLFGFSDTWQLVINTSTTIITFLMVFLIQNTQNRDAVAIHLKLDELLRAVEGARTGMIDLENLSDDELEAILAECDKNSPKLRLEALREDKRRATPAAAKPKPRRATSKPARA